MKTPAIILALIILTAVFSVSAERPQTYGFSLPYPKQLPELVIEPKADLNHPPCGAASIFAKVHRDARIHALGEVGSGYPSDPKTRAWLQGFVDRDEAFPASVRTRWGTVREMLQKSLF